MAKYDELTSVLKKEEFEKQLVNKMLWIKKNPSFMLIYIMIDLDNFKMINDTKGHKEGDKILKNVGKNLTRCVRCMRIENYFSSNRKKYPKIVNNDIVGKFGGDEFSIGIIIERRSVTNIINDRFEKACIESGCNASVGSTIFISQMDIHVQDLIEKADFFMYKKKRSKKNKICISENELKGLCGDYKEIHLQDDRRKYQRIKIKNMDCIFRIKNSYCFKNETNFHGKIIDISKGGIKFFSQLANSNLMKKGTILEIEFVLKGKRHLHKVSIVYFNQNNSICGCKFIN